MSNTGYRVLMRIVTIFVILAITALAVYVEIN